MYVARRNLLVRRPWANGWGGTVALSRNAANTVRLLDDWSGRAGESIQEGLMDDWILSGMFSWGMDEEERMR